MSDDFGKYLKQGELGIKPTIDMLIKNGTSPDHLYHVRFDRKTKAQHTNWIVSPDLDKLGIDIANLRRIPNMTNTWLLIDSDDTKTRLDPKYQQAFDELHKSRKAHKAKYIGYLLQNGDIVVRPATNEELEEYTKHIESLNETRLEAKIVADKKGKIMLDWEEHYALSLGHKVSKNLTFVLRNGTLHRIPTSLIDNINTPLYTDSTVDNNRNAKIPEYPFDKYIPNSHDIDKVLAGKCRNPYVKRPLPPYDYDLGLTGIDWTELTDIELTYDYQEIGKYAGSFGEDRIWLTNAAMLMPVIVEEICDKSGSYRDATVLVEVGRIPTISLDEPAREYKLPFSIKPIEPSNSRFIINKVKKFKGSGRIKPKKT